MQLYGIFDVEPAERSERRWRVDLPIDADDWKIGLVVGPSGSGKSTLAREVFGPAVVGEYDWPRDNCIADGFPERLGIKEITAALSSVGFSTPPSWVRPFRCLSTGEQFRATLARAICDERGLVVVDEFTSVVDRTVAKIGAAAVCKAVRARPGKRFVAVTCHGDVEEWLCPDWVLEMPSGEFSRRSLRRRPSIELRIDRVGAEAWDLFKRHHYLDSSLNKAAKCFVASWGGRPAAFASALCSPGKVSTWREHRTVCLPDFQGVGIGNALSDFVAGVMKCMGRPYRSTTSNPAMIAHRSRSPAWKMIRRPSRTTAGRLMNRTGHGGAIKNRATDRLTAGFEYVGPRRPDDAARLGVTRGGAA